jgi:hypothetical protein
MADGLIVIPARRGNAALVGRTATVQVINRDGHQAVDMCAFSRADLNECRDTRCRNIAAVSKGPGVAAASECVAHPRAESTPATAPKRENLHAQRAWRRLLDFAKHRGSAPPEAPDAPARQSHHAPPWSKRFGDSEPTSSGKCEAAVTSSRRDRMSRPEPRRRMPGCRRSGRAGPCAPIHVWLLADVGMRYRQRRLKRSRTVSGRRCRTCACPDID